MSLSEDVLMAIAGIAIALIGFSGAVTALGRRGSGKLSPSETLQIRTLVDPCIVTLYAAFVPIGLGLIAVFLSIRLNLKEFKRAIEPKPVLELPFSAGNPVSKS